MGRLKKSLQKSIEDLANFFQFFTLEKNDSKIFPKSVLKGKKICVTHNTLISVIFAKKFAFANNTYTSVFCFPFGSTMHS